MDPLSGDAGTSIRAARGRRPVDGQHLTLGLLGPAPL